EGRRALGRPAVVRLSLHDKCLRAVSARWRTVLVRGDVGLAPCSRHGLCGAYFGHRDPVGLRLRALVSRLECRPRLPLAAACVERGGLCFRVATRLSGPDRVAPRGDLLLELLPASGYRLPRPSAHGRLADPSGDHDLRRYTVRRAHRRTRLRL